MRPGQAPTQYLDFPQMDQALRNMIVNASRDADVRDLALRITQHVPQGFYMDEAQAIFEAVRAIRYTGDPAGEDMMQYPLLTFELNAGDCNNKAVAAGALARAIGFPVRLVYMFQEQQPDVAAGDFPVHVFLEVDVTKDERKEQQWVAMETTPRPDPASGLLTQVVEFGERFPAGGHVATSMV